MDVIHKISGNISVLQLIGMLNDEHTKIIGTTTIPKQMSDHERYDGGFEIVPNTHSDIVLATKQKLVTDDITVFKIPTYETSNTFGTTFIIGELMYGN